MNNEGIQDYEDSSQIQSNSHPQQVSTGLSFLQRSSIQGFLIWTDAIGSSFKQFYFCRLFAAKKRNDSSTQRPNWQTKSSRSLSREFLAPKVASESITTAMATCAKVGLWIQVTLAWWLGWLQWNGKGCDGKPTFLEGIWKGYLKQCIHVTMYSVHWSDILLELGVVILVHLFSCFYPQEIWRS